MKEIWLPCSCPAGRDFCRLCTGYGVRPVDFGPVLVSVASAVALAAAAQRGRQA